MVCWWDEVNGVASSIYLLVAERGKRGFSNRFPKLLEDEHERNPRGLRAWIDGPFGSPPDFAQYGTVLLIATGIGIATQLPFLKEIVKASSEWTTNNRRLFCMWELEHEGELSNDDCLMNADLIEADVDWVKAWIDEILDEDRRNDKKTRCGCGKPVIKDVGVLRIMLYNREDHTYGHNDRLSETSRRLSPEEVIRDQINNRQGRMMVSGMCIRYHRSKCSNLKLRAVSASASIRDRTRDAVLSYGDPWVTLYNCPFQPFLTRKGKKNELPPLS